MTARLDPPACNGAPPPKFRDPIVRRLSVTRGDWERAIRDHVPMDPTVGYVAMIVATHADFDTGANAHPGEASIARSVGRTTRTVRNALAWLEEHGFLDRTQRGSVAAQRKYADKYSLSLPGPLAASLGFWDDERNGAQWMERSWIKEGRPLRERLSQKNHRKRVTNHRKRVTDHRKPVT